METLTCYLVYHATEVEFKSIALYILFGIALDRVESGGVEGGRVEEGGDEKEVG